MLTFTGVLKLYNVYLENNNIIYSIDKLRLKTYIDYNTFCSLDFYINTYFKDKIFKFWISDKPMCFKYNYNIEIEEGKSFYFAFHHNNEKPDEHDGLFNLTIEFNPNKLKDNSIIMYILNLSGNWFIKRYDIAFDLKINILDLITDMSGRRIETTINRGWDNITKYLRSK